MKYNENLRLLFLNKNAEILFATGKLLVETQPTEILILNYSGE